MDAIGNPPLSPDGSSAAQGQAQPASFEPRIGATTHRTPEVLYEQPGICVTREWFIVAGRTFAISELTYLRTARGPRDPLTARAVVVTGMVLAALGAALSFIRDINQLSAAAYLALGAAAFVPVLLAAVGQRLRPRGYELWGQHRGTSVLLFSSDDERQYGQVTRALVRAREMSRLGAVADPVADTNPWQPPPR